MIFHVVSLSFFVLLGCSEEIDQLLQEIEEGPPTQSKAQPANPLAAADSQVCVCVCVCVCLCVCVGVGGSSDGVC